MIRIYCGSTNSQAARDLLCFLGFTAKMSDGSGVSYGPSRTRALERALDPDRRRTAIWNFGPRNQRKVSSTKLVRPVKTWGLVDGSGGHAMFGWPNWEEEAKVEFTITVNPSVSKKSELE